MAPIRPSDPSQSLASLVGGIVDDVRSLIRQEFALARWEVQNGWTNAKKAAALLVGAAALLSLSAMLLSFMLVKVLFLVMPNEWACFGIVGALWAVLGALLVYMGLAALDQVQFFPKQTVNSVTRDINAIKSSVSGNRLQAETLLNRKEECHESA